MLPDDSGIFLNELEKQYRSVFGDTGNIRFLEKKLMLC